MVAPDPFILAHLRLPSLDAAHHGLPCRTHHAHRRRHKRAAAAGALCPHHAPGLGLGREFVGFFIDYGVLHTHPLAWPWLLRLAVGGFVSHCNGYVAMIRQDPFAAACARLQVGAAPFSPTPPWASTRPVYAVPTPLCGWGRQCPRRRPVRWERPAKAAVDVLEPLNRLYVGKAIHTTYEEKLSFDFFWLSLLSLKFWFSYTFQIGPLVPAVVAIWHLDLSWWYPALELGKLANFLVCVVRCAPILLMYMIDTQIWFMLWTAGYGTVLGWTMRIGEVPTFTSLRLRFLSASSTSIARCLMPYR